MSDLRTAAKNLLKALRTPIPDISDAYAAELEVNDCMARLQSALERDEEKRMHVVSYIHPGWGTPPALTPVVVSSSEAIADTLSEMSYRAPVGSGWGVGYDVHEVVSIETWEEMERIHLDEYGRVRKVRNG